jgi:acetyl esterase/lipase
MLKRGALIFNTEDWIMNNYFFKKMKFVLMCMTILTATNFYAQNKVIKIWPGLAPGTESRTDNEKVNDGNIIDIYQPDLTVFLPSQPKENIPAVIIMPGGGYKQIVIDKEGYSIAKWLNENGVAAFVLKYRLDGSEALQDAQRALSFVRNNYKEYGIDPGKIGVIGFSAGGHLAANLSTHCEKDFYRDNIDSTSCKPDFMISVYGYLNPFLKDIDSSTPPAFLAHAGDDARVPVSESIDFYTALKKNNVPAELHVYEKGGHGFALREVDKPVNNWAKSCIDWLTSRKIVILK